MEQPILPSHSAQSRRQPPVLPRNGLARATGIRSPRRLAQILLIALVVTLATGAGDPSARYDQLSHQIMCPCGCNELLGECNHVGCPDSDAMRTKLMSAVNHGESTRTIFVDFQNEYGPTVLAAPHYTPFNRIAWIMPPFVLLLGFGLVAYTVRRWRRHQPPLAAPTPLGTNTPDPLRDRIRRETEI